jgi:hypothetical protein
MRVTTNKKTRNSIIADSYKLFSTKDKVYEGFDGVIITPPPAQTAPLLSNINVGWSDMISKIKV